MRDKELWILAAAILGGLLFLILSMSNRRKHRLLRDLPTTKTQGVFIGLVEVKGSAESAESLLAPLSEQSCVYYQYTVEEKWSRTVTETHTDSKGNRHTRTRHESGWTTVAGDKAVIPFFIKDDTGFVLVRPEGAKIEPQLVFDETVDEGDALYYAKAPAEAVAHSDHIRRFREMAIPLHAELYVVGKARERQDIVAPEIAKDKDGSLFLISTQKEETVQRNYSVASWLFWAAGLLTFGAIGYFASGQIAYGKPAYIVLIPALGIAVYLLLWGLSWVWMVFNSLVSLRQRVRQGWALVDVELKRRKDLIPSIAAAVGALGSHEKEVQTLVAALRSQSQATPPGQPGDDPEGLVPSLKIVCERYPALVADQGFKLLHGELVNTEQRIALARTYYNDIATHYATRLERVPDRWVAALASMKPEQLLTAENFERAPVLVNLP